MEPKRSERGVALILGILFTIVVTGMVLSGSLVMESHRAKTETSFRLHGQALQFARAGLTEGLGWFRKSPTQPVAAFDPQFAPAANPPILETLDPEIGIVREFQISGSVWGRYEVWKRWDSDPDPVRLAWRKQFQCEDISEASGATGKGSVWRLRSLGYVFRLVDPSVPFDQLPNRVLGSDILGTEIRRMTLVPPAQGAICVSVGASATIDNKVNIQGGQGAGIFYESSTGPIVRLNNPTIVGLPNETSTTPFDDSVEAVFGVTSKELQVLADDRITVASAFPSPVARNALYYVEVPLLDFTDTRPLLGTSVLYVKGNVNFAVGNKSFYTGLIYVEGDVTINEPCELNGTLICTGKVTIRGQTDWININYDDDALNALRKAIGQYRLSAPFRQLSSAE